MAMMITALLLLTGSAASRALDSGGPMWWCTMVPLGEA
jgi:hypothetical protein